MHTNVPAVCTCFTLRKLSRSISRLYDLHLARVGLKTTQYSVLKHIAKSPLPMKDLAALLVSDRTTLTRNLKPLIASGWVDQVSGVDSRQRIVRITAAGRTKIASAQLAWRAAQSEIETTFGVALLQALHRDINTATLLLTPLLKERLHVDFD